MAHYTTTMRQMAALQLRAELLLRRAGDGEYRLSADTQDELLRIRVMPQTTDATFLASLEDLLQRRRESPPA